MKSENHVPYILIVSIVAIIGIVVLVLNLRGAGEAVFIPSSPLPTTSGPSLCGPSSLWSACGIGGGSYCLVNTSNAPSSLLCVALASEGQRCSIPGYIAGIIGNPLPGPAPKGVLLNGNFQGECADGLLCGREPLSSNPTCHKICTADSQCADGTCRLNPQFYYLGASPAKIC